MSEPEPDAAVPIHEEEAVVLRQDALPAEQYTLRVRAARAAAGARPGTFAHIRCAPDLPMRRPLSIMRADPQEGWLEFLYKVVGAGTRRLAAAKEGDRVNLLAPIGRSFSEAPGRDHYLLLGGGVGIPPIVFLAEQWRRRPDLTLFTALGSEIPFPFQARPSQELAPAMPAGVIAAMPLLEDWGVTNRLASNAGFPGCYDGHVTDLGRAWLDGLQPGALGRAAIYACGPEPMLEAAAALAREYDVPCQIAVEEYMACGVGGCAGCNIPIRTAQGPAMKRVCVDGPVFPAAAVYPHPAAS